MPRAFQIVKKTFTMICMGPLSHLYARTKCIGTWSCTRKQTGNAGNDRLSIDSHISLSVLKQVLKVDLWEEMCLPFLSCPLHTLFTASPCICISISTVSLKRQAKGKQAPT